MRSEEQLSCQSHNYHNEWSMRYLPRKEGLASISQSCDAWLFCLILGYLCGIIIACAIVVTKLSGACAANRDAGLDRDNWCRRGCGMACGVLPPRLCRRADFRGPLGRSRPSVLARFTIETNRMVHARACGAKPSDRFGHKATASQRF